MEGRCVVETWTEFGFFVGQSCTAKVKSGLGTEVFLCTGSDEVYVFNTQERNLTAVLQFPGPVSDLAESPDKQLLYVCCSSGVYCVSLTFVLSRSQSSRCDASQGPAELKISAEFLVVDEEGALSLLLVGSVLLILYQRDASWLLSLYRTPKQAPSNSYEILNTFSLPLVSDITHRGNTLRTQLSRSPVMICLYCGPPTATSLSSTSSTKATLTNHFYLEPVLFKLLFGVDAALSKSPVILCGLPDGRLCFLPMFLPGSQLRLLHSLEQPVVFVGASVFTETVPGHAQCLVALGELGRVLLIKTNNGGQEAGGNTAGFTEGCVAGPVVCGCVDKHYLYYSTGSDLLELDLLDGSHGSQGEERKETSSESAGALQVPTSLNVCRVIGLVKPTYSSAGEVQLLGLTVRGQLQRISLPARREDSRLSKLPATHVGRGVKDLLSAIGDVCERASVLKMSIKSKNQILRQLNQVLNISFLLIDSKKHVEQIPSQEKPISCHAMTRWSRLLQKDSLNLTCVLDNSSPYILEQGWTLSINVCPLSYSPSIGGESSSTNFSFPFNSLHPGEMFEVSLPLAASGDASFPVTVNCSLIFSLTGLLGEEELVGSIGLKRNCIILPLNTLTVDWLHVLRMNSPTASYKNCTSQSNSVTIDTIKAFLSSHQHRSSGRSERGGERVSQHQEEQYSASVHLSPELLRDTQIFKSSALDPQGPNLDPQNLCVCLLDWLLSEGHGGVKVAHQGDKIVLSSSVACVQGPDGNTVKLTVKEVDVGKENLGRDKSVFTVEVRIGSTSMAAVCGVHHAVLQRVQTLLQKVPEVPASTIRAHNLGLREALRRAERLLRQIQQSRISEAFSAGMSAGQMTQSVLCVYRELRENPLVIM